MTQPIITQGVGWQKNTEKITDPVPITPTERNINTTGAACSGVDGAAGRVLTLTNASLTQEPVSVALDRQWLVPVTDFTVAHLAANTTITFINPVWNAQQIVVFYYQ